jgi:hypothetical protein
MLTIKIAKRAGKSDGNVGALRVGWFFFEGSKPAHDLAPHFSVGTSAS